MKMVLNFLRNPKLAHILVSLKVSFDLSSMSASILIFQSKPKSDKVATKQTKQKQTSDDYFSAKNK